MTSRRCLLLLCTALLALLPACNLPSIAETSDTDAIPCSPAALITALAEAQAQASSEITLAAGCVYQITQPYETHPQWMATGLPAIRTQVTIHGDGATLLRTPLSSTSTSAYRFFYIESGGSLTLDNLRLENGGWAGELQACTDPQGTCSVGGAMLLMGGEVNLQDVELVGNAARLGGAISVGVANLNISGSLFEGNLAFAAGAIDTGTHSETTISTSTFRGNQASVHESRGTAGAVDNSGSMTIQACLFDSNLATDYGGALINTGYLDISDSAIVHNWANEGGAIVNDAGRTSLLNSTISGNMSQRYVTSFQIGAVYVTYGYVDVVYSTIAENIGQGTGISGLGDTNIHLENAIIANNSGGDCYFIRPILTASGVLDSDGSCPDAMLTADPRLGPLADNGGGTLTHALAFLSPAVDAGSGDDCPGSDQRGIARPYNGVCDLGAFEYREAEMGGVPPIIPNDLVIIEPEQPAVPDISVPPGIMDSACLQGLELDLETHITLPAGTVVKVLGITPNGAYIVLYDPCDTDIAPR
jgi:hypothetical protein